MHLSLIATIKREAVKSKLQLEDGLYRLVEEPYKLYQVGDIMRPNEWLKGKLSLTDINDFQRANYVYRSYNLGVVQISLKDYSSNYDMHDPHQWVVVWLKAEMPFESNKEGIYVQGARASWRKHEFEILDIEENLGPDTFLSVEGKTYYVSPERYLYAKVLK